MGSGKGKVSYWAVVVKPGAVIFEITGLKFKEATHVLLLASYKLPVKVRVVSRHNLTS